MDAAEVFYGYVISVFHFVVYMNSSDAGASHIKTIGITNVLIFLALALFLMVMEQKTKRRRSLPHCCLKNRAAEISIIKRASTVSADEDKS